MPQSTRLTIFFVAINKIFPHCHCDQQNLVHTIYARQEAPKPVPTVPTVCREGPKEFLWSTSTHLHAYKIMSDQKTVPKGLRENEVERGNFKKLLIPYIPVEDKIGEKVKHEALTFKVKIDDKITVNASVWTGRNP